MRFALIKALRRCEFCIHSGLVSIGVLHAESPLPLRDDSASFFLHQTLGIHLPFALGCLSVLAFKRRYFLDLPLRMGTPILSALFLRPMANLKERRLVFLFYLPGVDLKMRFYPFVLVLMASLCLCPCIGV